MEPSPPPSRTRSKMRQLCVESIWLVWDTCRTDRASIRHQHWQGRVRQDMARRASEYHLAQPALGIGALDEEIATERLRGRQYGFPGRAAFEFDRHRHSLDAVTLQILGRLRVARSRYCRSALDMEHSYALGLAQPRHGQRGGAFLLGAAGPRPQNIGPDLGRRRRRRDQNRAAAVEQPGFDRLVVHADRIGIRPAHDDNVEY